MIDSENPAARLIFATEAHCRTAQISRRSSRMVRRTTAAAFVRRWISSYSCFVGRQPTCHQRRRAFSFDLRLADRSTASNGIVLLVTAHRDCGAANFGSGTEVRSLQETYPYQLNTTATGNRSAPGTAERKFGEFCLAYDWKHRIKLPVKIRSWRASSPGNSGSAKGGIRQASASG